ncbi:MAG: hypothetical protein LWX07_11930, partial [Bacteroidetes bacterium]|nr:hypothetical protein [Bacteroidota bacterium]
MNERGSDPYGSTKYFDKKHLKKFSFENEFLQVYGYYDKSKSKPLITETDLIFAAGDIYKRNDINADAGYAGILKEIKVNPANVSKYKGNYVVCRIDLLNKDIVILNSQLGMKHIYYSNTGNRVYAGNNLNLFRADFTAFNKNAVLQQLVFTFTITDETLLNGVYRLMPGEYAYSDGEEFSISRYFDIQNLILKDDTRAFDAEEFTHLFNRSIMERAHNGINVSFSGGFKGRTIVSSLINQAIKYKSYSFGIKGRDNTEIPLRISEELKINYESIYLDTEYENNYTECAKEAIYYSDGVSYNEKASHIFVYRKLAENDNSVLSGLAGEGIMEPVNFRKGCINLLYYYTVYLGRKINFHEYLKNTGVLRFLNHDFVSEVFGITELVREKFRDLSGFRLFDKG